MTIVFFLLLLLQSSNPALAAEYIVGPQDRLAITVYEEPTLTKTVTVDSAVLTGPAEAIPGFTDQLASDLGMPVNPGIVAEAAPGALPAGEAGRLTVAAGLAVEDRS